MQAPRKSRFKIFSDPVKLRHTTHWDMDFLSREEYEAQMSSPKRPAAGQDANKRTDEGGNTDDGSGD